MKKLHLVALCIAFSSISVHSANWVNLATATNGSEYEIDTDSVVIKNGLISYWTQVVYPSEQEVKNSYPQKYYKSSKLKWIANCAERTTSIVTSIKFNSDGESVDSYTLPKPIFEEVVPESVGEGILTKVCKAYNSSGTKTAPKKF